METFVRCACGVCRLLVVVVRFFWCLISLVVCVLLLVWCLCSFACVVFVCCLCGVCVVFVCCLCGVFGAVVTFGGCYVYLIVVSSW